MCLWSIPGMEMLGRNLRGHLTETLGLGSPRVRGHGLIALDYVGCAISVPLFVL